MADGQNELLDLVAAACRVASTVLPRGGRGVEAALLWLDAFPAGCQLGLVDLTTSAPGLFRAFVAAGLIPSCPSDGAMTGGIRLIAAVSPLVTGHSPRTWTAWMGSALDPASATAVTLRGAVTPAMLRTPATPATAPRRVGSIRAERDRLAAALADHERERRTAAERLAALTVAHEESASHLRAAREQHDRITAERDRITAERDRITAERERITADLHAAATRQRSCDTELTRTAAALVEAKATNTKLVSKLDEATRLARTSGEQAQSLMRTRDQLQAELNYYKRYTDELAKDLTNISARLEDQTTYNHELAADLETRRAALDRQGKSLETANASLAREQAGHAETRKRLQDAERRGLTYVQECETLRTANKAHEAAPRALVEICKWLDIDPNSCPETSQRLEAILTAIDHQQMSDRRFVHRVEQLLLKQDYELIVARFEAECYRTRHRDATISAAVEEAEPEIRERSEERVRKKMAKLMLPENDDAPRT